MSLRLYDAHNHFQDERLQPYRESIVQETRAIGVVRMVVNGCCESDWPSVLALAKAMPEVLPSYGYHPWYVRERSPEWQESLRYYLDQMPSAIGEIGLDRWIKDVDPVQQEEAFVWQLGLAAERNIPVSIHCLQAWGRLLDLLKQGPRPARGFVLHSFGGPGDFLEPLAELGAYFSLPGYFAFERKLRQRETFRQVPLERLLIETDAPEQCLPPDRVQFPLQDPEANKPLNHPANLAAVYRFAAEWLGRPVEELAAQVEANFLRLFGSAG